MKIGDFFQKSTRDDGSTYVTLTDNRPDWLYDAVYEAHQSDLPNDWIYSECWAAACAIDDGALSDDDDLHEHADSQVDIYTNAVFRWQADMCLSSTYSYAEERANELGTDTSDMVKAVQTIQYCAIETIASTILQAWRNHEEESSDDE
jgi:hypothetical protein